MMYKALSTVGVLLAASLVSATVMAIGTVGTSIESTGFFAIGAGVVPDYEGSDDYEVVPAIGGRYTRPSGRFIDLGGTSGSERAARLSLNLIDSRVTETWTMGPILQYRLQRDGGDVDDDKVGKMGDVDAETEAGAFIGWQKDRFELQVAFATDISDKSNGSLGYLEGGYKIPYTSKINFRLGAHLTYASSGYMEEYFDVSQKDAARSGLMRYNADSGLKDTGLDVSMMYSFNKTWGMFGSVSYTRMLGDAEDSPLVDDRGDENQYKGALTVMYMF